MIKVLFKNNQLQFDQPVTLMQAAVAIDKDLAKKVIAGKIAGKILDLSYLITQDCEVDFVTANEPEGLGVIRHSTAHLMAAAVKQLFPQVQVTIGPTIEDGFYYDFAKEDGFSEDDLVRIEKKMRELIKENTKLESMVVSREEAIKLFTDLGETYKLQLIEAIPAHEQVTLYRQGDFVDLCRGPHVYSTGKLGAFKLTKLAGAYWRGDSKNEMLQRIYGTAWASKEDLDNYLQRIEEAKRRDHRLLAKKMNLFHLQEEAPGMIFWHPDGWTIYQKLRGYISDRIKEFGYQEVNTPQLIDRVLWEKSGHWSKFGEQHMFITESENRVYAIKPMSCPCHIQIFKQGLKSYRDLPIRYAEFGCCHRNEHSGTLHGVFRVRGFVQDDAHIFCTEDQIASECMAYVDQIREVYAHLGFPEIIVKVATRPPQRVGADELWDKAERALMDVLNLKAIKWELNPGEGAFYGPKIEFSLRDCLGRVWQCGTLQVDFSMPERLGAYYIAEDGSRKAPVMLHRAMLGSLERFVGILLEQTGGDLPLWLAPIQAAMMTVTDSQHAYASEVFQKLKKHGLRVVLDLRNEKIGFKIREHSMRMVPFLLIMGDREVQSGTVAVRARDGRDLGSMQLTEIVALLNP